LRLSNVRLGYVWKNNPAHPTAQILIGVAIGEIEQYWDKLV
jgi:hypothetical protein